MTYEEALEAQRAVDVLARYGIGSHILHKQLYREIMSAIEGKQRDFRDINKKVNDA